MTLPTEEEYIEVLFKLQKFVVVSGHAEQLSIPPDTEAYRFNVKMQLDPPFEDDQLFRQFCNECFDESVAIARSMWNWIADIQRAGRNLGWAVVTLKGPGVVEWNQDYRALASDDDPEIDAQEILWMLIQHRLSELEQMKEFVDDQVKTFTSRAPEWLERHGSKSAKT